MLGMKTAEPVRIRTKWPEFFEEFLASGEDLMEVTSWDSHYANLTSAYYTARKGLVRAGYDDRLEVIQTSGRLYLHRKK